MSPLHGVGTVVEKAPREHAGLRREYLTIEIPLRGLRLALPADAAQTARLRPLASPAEARRALNTMAAMPRELPTNWRNRQKEAAERLAAGDLCALAELVRDLTHLSSTKPLNGNDRSSHATARELLESELSVVLDLPPGRAGAEIDNLLSQRAGGI